MVTCSPGLLVVVDAMVGVIEGERNSGLLVRFADTSVARSGGSADDPRFFDHRLSVATAPFLRVVQSGAQPASGFLLVSPGSLSSFCGAAIVRLVDSVEVR